MLGTATPAQPAIVQSAPIVAAPGTGNAATASANDVVDSVQKFYSNIKHVTAQFRQSVTNDTFGSTKTSDGTAWIMKPGKMRWDYLEKKKTKVEVKKSFLSNGKSLYVVEHDNMQVVKKSLENDLMPVAVSFLYGKGDLKAEFNAELDKTNKYGAKGEIVLKLAPKKPSAQYKNLFLVVSPDNFRVTQSIIIDSSNNVNHFRFFSPDFEKPIKDTWFEFDERSVKNYRVVDADQEAKQQGSGSAAMPPKLPAVPPAPAPAPAKK
ncbi:MAG: outer membrane lipoprotein carrier protein LolA [Deltaproteobacteria bacterium]|nr:outer membrane lipoprotein carrier protein LolA [Deltaproteobacteria bacterium]